jgi:aspartokinase-like uncharacterized kinase
VKVGGSLGRHGALPAVMRAIARARPRPLVVPGGGSLADAVRAAFAQGGVSDETGHRMALLALDQSALWLADLASAGETDGGAARVVRSLEEIHSAAAEDRLSVLAPSRWLETEDPLPASWLVTSDSIAAWVAGRVGARRLLVIKSFSLRAPRVGSAELEDAVDGCFLRVLPPQLECRLVDGRDVGVVAAALRGDRDAGTLLEIG